MSLYQWLLSLHVLAAFALVAGIASYGVMVLSSGDSGVRRALAPPALVLWNVGGLGTLVLGIWLAIQVDAYGLLDFWIVAAIVLWLVASAAGGPLSRGLRDEAAQMPPGRARLLLTVMALATVALLIDMIYKPGV